MKISVVIPIYNEEEYISKGIENLLKQKLKPNEIIIVDDGSTDNGVENVKDIRNEKIKIFYQNHQGPGKARNLGAEKAKGDVLIFVDADMHFDKDYIKNLVEPLKKNKKIIGTTHELETATNTEDKWSKLWGKIRVSKKTAKDIKIFRAIRKKEFLRLGGFDQKYGYADDQTFWYKYKIKPSVAKNTICYHRNPSSLKETFKQAKWIGASWKERFSIFRFPIIGHITVIGFFLIFIFLVILKSVSNKENVSFLDKIKFYKIKFFGYAIGVFRAVFLNKVWR